MWSLGFHCGVSSSANIKLCTCFVIFLGSPVSDCSITALPFSLHIYLLMSLIVALAVTVIYFFLWRVNSLTFIFSSLMVFIFSKGNLTLFVFIIIQTDMLLISVICSFMSLSFQAISFLHLPSLHPSYLSAILPSLSQFLFAFFLFCCFIVL